MKGLFLVTILLSVVPLHAMKEEEKLPNKLPNMECVKYFNDKFVIQELNVAGTMQSELATVKQSIVDETKYMPEPEAIIYVVQAFCTDARMKKHFDKIWDSFKDDTDSNKFTSQEIAETKLFLQRTFKATMKISMEYGMLQQQMASVSSTKVKKECIIQ